MRILSWTTGVAIAIVAATAPTASAAATTFSEPFSGAVPNDCTGEMFFAEGTMHVSVTGSVTLDGFKSHTEMNLTGVKGIGLVSGARYVMNQQSSDMQHADGDDAQQTIEQTIIMNRQGETGALVTGDDFQLHVIAHLTVTNGVTKATKTDLRADCR